MPQRDILPWMGTDYQSEVIVQYQTSGFVMRPLVQTRSFSNANKTEMKFYGAMKASRRAIGAPVPVADVDAPTVQIQMVEDSLGAYVDKTEALGHNADEKIPMVDVATRALGRGADQLLYDAIRTHPDVQVEGGSNGAVLTFGSIKKYRKIMTKKRVSGEMCAVVGPAAFDNLLSIDQFNKSDYIGANNLPLPDLQAKKWLGFTWIEDPELASDDGPEDGFLFEKMSLGYGWTQDVETEWSRVHERKSYFLRCDIVHGASVLQPKGVLRFKVPN